MWRRSCARFYITSRELPKSGYYVHIFSDLVSRRTPFVSDWSHAPLRTGRAQLRHPAPRIAFSHICAMLVSFVLTVSPVQSPDSVSLQAVSCVTPLPSSGITRCHQYYGSNPTSQWLLPSLPLQLVWHTLLTKRPFWDLPGSVSYTHLTLPTILLV